ncbi:hypothetical protein OG321_35385 [Streptomyces sp. NBC_00424]|uniref:hypothetical protein n=1 Tax=Streptomyces sp. NBC_00424 TaxID=2903648 RepID=UPI002255D6D4|nr:hypothetical protein [Streptomyces sp. NBC_00424]MCX5077754.1 hypothetical protein [Streptomyces sp. NBC_00424]
MHDHEKAGSHTGAGNSRTPARRPASAPPAQHGLLGLQAAAGNAAVVQMLRDADHPWAREQHEHGAGCGHQENHQEIATSSAPVQRSAVHDVLRSAGKLGVQRAVEPRTAPAAGAAHEGRGGPVTVQTAFRKPPPVPNKPDKLRLGGAEQTSGADQTNSAGQTSAAAEPAQAPSDTPAHGYTLAESASLVFFRADGRSPEVIRQANGMRSRNNTSVATELAMFLEDPIAYARAHVSSPKPTLVSTALDADCGGYASNDRHLYRIQVSGWHKFAAPPARSKILTKPTVYANSTSLESATAAVIGPVGPTQEMDFIGGIPLAAITGCRRPGESGFSAL